ncbi:LptA/OstA family protein [Treponema sp.]|uniref:LptA/OstA family protein n=1 Tax=Treponema sp. TaxID=166 RepID=UPI0025D4A322|nr:LptA/OstA family protein [Treponema sp.]MCR5218870.1 LPS export ABC transporter periplasmic protein LptC [Treponema sp.]
MKIFNKTLILTIFLLTSLAFCLYGEKITFSASYMTGTAGDNNGKTTLSGNARVQTESMEISADQIELSGKDYRTITASGNINGTNLETKMTFTCQSMTYDRETKVALLENAVHLVDTENDVTADAEIIEYSQNSNVAVMQIQVNIVQKDNKCTAAHAIYRKNEQMLEMSGNPNITQGTDNFRAQNITLNLETQEITLDGRVKGSVTTSSKEESSGPAPSDNMDSPSPDSATENAPAEDSAPQTETSQTETNQSTSEENDE